MSGVSGAGGDMKAPEGLVTVLKGILGVLVAFAGWELVRQTGFIDKRDLPAVLDVLGAAFSGLTQGDMSLALFETLRSWISGLALATLIGIAAGIALALLPGLELATRPILEFLRPIPSVALIPVALLVLGIGTSMQLFMIVFAAVWPVLFSTKAGVESIDPRYLETGRVLGFKRAERVMRILLPASLPYIATGIRTAAAIALVLAITVEMLTGRPGIGFYIENVRLNGLTAEMWGGILVTGIFGYLVNTLFIVLERLVLPWSPENRDG